MLAIHVVIAEATLDKNKNVRVNNTSNSFDVVILRVGLWGLDCRSPDHQVKENEEVFQRYLQ